MAHEITTRDGLVLLKDAAWHGLGKIVEDAPTALQALELAGMDWEVDGLPLRMTLHDGTEVTLPDWVGNTRRGNTKPFGIVSTEYVRFQNKQVAEFIEELVEQDDTIKIESAGSIREGAKIWFLVRGESFGVRNRKGDDEVKPYICVSNGHDGATGLRCTPTTVRVVCSNTLHMVIPRYDNETGRMIVNNGGFASTHVGDIKRKVEEAKKALGLYQQSIAETRIVIDALASKDINQDIVKQFFLEAYTKQFGSIDLEAGSATRDKAHDAYAAFSHRFSREEQAFGASRWTLFNAYSGWLQHDRTKTLNVRYNEKKAHANLFGIDAGRTSEALSLALAV